jgi:hypothetical protein
MFTRAFCLSFSDSLSGKKFFEKNVSIIFLFNLHIGCVLDNYLRYKMSLLKHFDVRNESIDTTTRNTSISISFHHLHHTRVLSPLLIRRCMFGQLSWSFQPSTPPLHSFRYDLQTLLYILNWENKQKTVAEGTPQARYRPSFIIPIIKIRINKIFLSQKTSTHNAIIEKEFAMCEWNLVET